MKTNRFIFGAVGAATLAILCTTAQAQPFTYNPQDLLVGFRNGGTSDLIVDIGPASQYYGAAYGSSFNVTGFTSSQLTSVFGGLDGLSFSVMGDVRTSGNVAHPLNTLWVTSARLDLNTQSDPWSRASQFSQGNPASKIDGIAAGALSYSSSISAGANNTGTAVAVPANWKPAGGSSYTIGIGGAGNFANTFQGSVENTTPAGFGAGAVGVRSDLYELDPGSGPGTYLGYFEFSPSGNLAFYAVPEPASWALAGIGLLALTFTNKLRAKY